MALPCVVIIPCCCKQILVYFHVSHLCLHFQLAFVHTSVVTCLDQPMMLDQPLFGSISVGYCVLFWEVRPGIPHGCIVLQEPIAMLNPIPPQCHEDLRFLFGRVS